MTVINLSFDDFKDAVLVLLDHILEIADANCTPDFDLMDYVSNDIWNNIGTYSAGIYQSTRHEYENLIKNFISHLKNNIDEQYFIQIKPFVDELNPYFLG